MAETPLGLTTGGYGQNIHCHSANFQNSLRTTTLDISGDIVSTRRFIDGSAAIVGGSGQTAGTNGLLTHPAIGSNVIAPHADTNAASVINAGVHTYTVDEIMSGYILRDCNGAGRIDLLPSATLMVAVLTAVNDTAHFTIANVSDTGTEPLTVNGPADGTGTVVQHATGSASKTIRLDRLDAGYIMIRMTAVGGSPTYDVFILAGGTSTG